MEKQIENLKLLEKLRQKKKKEKQDCEMCGNKRFSDETYPKSECQYCS